MSNTQKGDTAKWRSQRLTDSWQKIKGGNMVTINTEEVKATEFAWDGCHKFYLVNTPADKEQLLLDGYTLFPIEELSEMWENSCSLKFISDGDLNRTWVQQFSKAIIGG